MTYNHRLLDRIAPTVLQSGQTRKGRSRLLGTELRRATPEALPARQAKRSAKGGARSVRRGSPARSAEPHTERGGRAGEEAGLGRRQAKGGRGRDRTAGSWYGAGMPVQQAAAGRRTGAGLAKTAILCADSGKEKTQQNKNFVAFNADYLPSFKISLVQPCGAALPHA